MVTHLRRHASWGTESCESLNIQSNGESSAEALRFFNVNRNENESFSARSNVICVHLLKQGCVHIYKPSCTLIDVNRVVALLYQLQYFVYSVLPVSLLLALLMIATLPWFLKKLSEKGVVFGT